MMGVAVLRQGPSPPSGTNPSCNTVLRRDDASAGPTQARVGPRRPGLSADVKER